MNFWLRALSVWLLLMAVETVHGTLRQFLLAPAIGDLKARQLSVFTGMALIFVVALLTTRWIGSQGLLQSLTIGLLWALLTVVFEILLGSLLGLSTQRLLEDYDLRRGGLMVLGISFLVFAPLLAQKVRPRPVS